MSEYETTGECRKPSIYKNGPPSGMSDRLFFILVCIGLSLKAKGLVPAETDKELSERLTGTFQERGQADASS